MLRQAKIAAAAFALWAAAIGAVDASTRRSAAQESPAGDGATLVREKCTLCHEADLITQQRLSRPGWTREVEKMMRWGTELSDSEKQTVIDYLTVRFGPRAVTAPSSSGKGERGRVVFEASCLSCHEADLTEQQRLSRAGWTREVDKMIRWGADVKDSDKDALIEYLSGRFGAGGRSGGQ